VRPTRDATSATRFRREPLALGLFVAFRFALFRLALFPDGRVDFRAVEREPRFFAMPAASA
jgi:hypothetical protein